MVASDTESNVEAAGAVGKIPSGLFIVVARSDNKVDGFLGSFIQQVSMDPLRISLAIKPGRPAYDMIQSGGLFTVNIVGEHDSSFLKHFWRGYDPDNSPFSELSHHDGSGGGLVLDAALAAMECRRVESFSPGDHDLVIADVLSSTILSEEAKPLVHIRKHGLSY
jgi:flavin reductase (DIM6/NTAB) family NADH-FMN oxidoreductase RutF